ncbi:uncharacterized protein Z520_11894 [Fonsecaea multimorphosa CBS 102226]|uniref:Uncharacterized protein n=1 Tax=Fonsecaea multimorphosa CBS 102226 TaxID=1442371 RepID=A0A0D2JPQ2_9EURO|nr:uncharacterized protein Z520_11894 [Fonsecaea multimorphosa CBS 102226]KIX92419.1 hypothetical protein Z520_11894 [Fonsecaea multimorphosa CBS 102226]OAL17789.1 hypothetical protein AYO22_11317 [Fonsecaea multimorphosa]
MKSSALLLLVSFVAADISLETFSDDACGNDGGSSVTNVHANSGNAADSSNCIATSQYQSVNVISVDPGFQCNLYSDNACNNFISSVNTAQCTPVIGSGVVCFNQALFDNPFAQSTAEVTVGTNQIRLISDPSGFLSEAVNQACGTNGCDPTNQATLSASFQSDPNCQPLVAPCDQTTCTISASMTGNYDNTNQRDYMASLLQQIFAKSFEPVSFGQVVINDQSGNNQAEMAYTFSITCSEQSDSFDCGGFLGTLTSSVLGLVPGVGGLVAGAFSVACQALSGS